MASRKAARHPDSGIPELRRRPRREGCPCPYPGLSCAVAPTRAFRERVRPTAIPGAALELHQWRSRCHLDPALPVRFVECDGRNSRLGITGRGKSFPTLVARLDGGGGRSSYLGAVGHPSPMVSRQPQGTKHIVAL